MQPGFREPWVLLSDLSAGRARVQAYRRRMRVESSFQDFKRRSWDIDVERTIEPSRLLPVCLHDGSLTWNQVQARSGRRLPCAGHRLLA